MLSGLYLAGNSLVVQAERQDAIAANLANASTAGYKRICVGVSARSSVFADELAAATGQTEPYQCLAATSRLDTAPGPLTATGNPCDLALDGPGYFAVQAGGGELYTRNGSFRLSPDGTLVDSLGRAVLGQRGPIRLQGEQWEVSADGTVSVEGAAVATLKVVDFPAALATKQGDGVFAAPPAAVRVVPAPQVTQRQIERSNVQVVEEMVNMITALRTFEAAQRIIQAQDRTLDKAVNDVGR